MKISWSETKLAEQAENCDALEACMMYVAEQKLNYSMGRVISQLL